MSFALNIAKYRSDGVADFYSPQTRFWELLAGSTLAYITLYNIQFWSQVKMVRKGLLGKTIYAMVPNINGKILRDVLSILGGVFITASVFLINKEMYFPGTWALLPVVGAVMIITAGNNAWLNSVILSNRILVWFGLISFPLYLWHWPLLTFARIVEANPLAPSIRIVAVFISIVLAWLTYRFIERPLRFGKKEESKAIVLVVLMFAIGAIGYTTYERDGLQFRLNQSRKTHPIPTRMQLDNYEDMEITKNIWNDTPTIKSRDFLLYRINQNQQISVAVIGDSHANRLYLGIQNQSDFSVMNVGRGTCPPFINVEVLDKTSSPVSCQPLTNNYLNYVKNNNEIKVVVINAFYEQYNRDVTLVSFGKKIGVTEALMQTINFLTESGKVVVVALDVPEVHRGCYVKNQKRNIPVWNMSNDNLCAIEKSVQYDVGNGIRNVVSELNKTSRHVFLYDPADILCSDGFCGEIDNKNYLYHTDGNHLNEFGINIVGDILFKQISQYVANY